jgi:hypothetical protein
VNAHQMERAAYIAAHRILTTDLSAPELACPGARRSAIVDNMAKIIKSVYEAHSQRMEEPSGVRILMKSDRMKSDRKSEKKAAAAALK